MMLIINSPARAHTYYHTHTHTRHTNAHSPGIDMGLGGGDDDGKRFRLVPLQEVENAITLVATKVARSTMMVVIDGFAAVANGTTD